MKKHLSKRNEMVNKRLMESWGYKEKNVSLDEEGAADIVAADKEAAAFMKAGNAKLGPYVELLKKIQNDPEFRAIANAGLTDGNPSDEALTTKEADVRAADLRPTQAEIGLDQSLSDQMLDKWDNTAAALSEPIALNAPGGKTPLLVFNGKYILDGHHRWSQVMMTNPTGLVKIYSIAGNALKTEEDALKIMNLAIAATATQPLVTNDFEGENLYRVGPETIFKYVVDNMSEKVIKLFLQAGKMPEQPGEKWKKYYKKYRAERQKPLSPEYEKYLEPLAAYYTNNFNAFKAFGPGTHARIAGMPQAGDAGLKQADVNNYLKQGKVNYVDPKPTDFKRDGDEEK